MKTRFPAMAMLLVLAAAAPLAAAERPAGFVALFRGQAWVERDGRRLEPRAGLPVQVGDVLVTGQRGRLKVLFSDDALVSLGSRSRLEITRHQFVAGGRRTSRLQLLAGKVRALVQRLVAGTRADFEIRTTNAVAGVRGTEFVMEKTAAGARLTTLSGAVAFSRAGQEPVLVAAGQAADLGGGQGRVAPVRVAAAELERLRAETDTEANPVAVAMVLPPRPEDTLAGPVAGSGPGAGQVTAADQDPARVTRGCPGCCGCPVPPDNTDWSGGGRDDFGPASAEAGFSGESGINVSGDGQNGVLGAWTNPDDKPGMNAFPVQLTILLHRN